MRLENTYTAHVISDTLFAVCLFFSIVYLIDLFCALLLAILVFISDKKQSASFSIPVCEVGDLGEAKINAVFLRLV